MTKPWCSIWPLTRSLPALNMTWAKRVRERGVRTSVGWLVMTGRVTLGQSDTAIMVTQTQLCIMNRVPGISGIPGRLRRRNRSSSLGLMSWMSISANQRIPGHLTNQKTPFFIKYVQQSKLKITWNEIVEHQSMFYHMHSNLWAMRQKKVWVSFGSPSLGVFEMSNGKRSKRINSWLGYVSWSFLILCLAWSRDKRL